MSYVPGFKHDIFISYAHRDDAPITPNGWGWVRHFAKRLEDEVSQHLGRQPSIWIDTRDLDSYVDFDKQIHDDLDAALLIVIATPKYSRSDYCRNERAVFRELVSKKHAVKFASGALQNALFILKAVALTEKPESHRKEDLASLNDLFFCEGEGFESRKFSLESRDFEDALHTLQGQVCGLLNKMRNRCSPVFLWPRDPDRNSGLRDLRANLCNELSDAEYRVLPELAGGVTTELPEAVLFVFLAGSDYDPVMEDLVSLARNGSKPWVVWQSAAASTTKDERQRALLDGLANDPSHLKTILTHNSSLKDEVLAKLRSSTAATPVAASANRIYIVYDASVAEDFDKATYVMGAIPGEFDVEPAETKELTTHNEKLKASAGVLLVWGKAEYTWYQQEFRKINLHARLARSRGICLFQPREMNKESELANLGSLPNLYVIPQFESFNPAALKPFLDALRPPSAE